MTEKKHVDVKVKINIKASIFFTLHIKRPPIDILNSH